MNDIEVDRNGRLPVPSVWFIGRRRRQKFYSSLPGPDVIRMSIHVLHWHDNNRLFKVLH